MTSRHVSDFRLVGVSERQVKVENVALHKMSAELACTYAALILNDDDVEITGDKITAILKVNLMI